MWKVLFWRKEMMNDYYEKQAEKILSLDSNWINRDDEIKNLCIKIMINTLKYMENNNVKKEIINL